MNRAIETEKRCKCGRYYRAESYPGETIPTVCAACDPEAWAKIAEARTAARMAARKARAEATA